MSQYPRTSGFTGPAGNSEPGSGVSAGANADSGSGSCAAAIFAMIYLESMGSPVPGETGVIAASLLASRGELSIVSVYVAVLAGELESEGYVGGVAGEGDAGGELFERGGAVEAVGQDVFARGEHAVRAETGGERGKQGDRGVHRSAEIFGGWADGVTSEDLR